MHNQGLRHARGVRTGRATRPSLFLGALALYVLWVAPASAQFVFPEVRSAHVGVYTEEQAEAGAEVYANVCSECHNPTNPLSGSKFLSLWSGKPLWRLYEFISTRMPYGNGGMLPPDQYNAVVAYVLRENGYPAGDTPLPFEPLEIAYINLDPHPEGRVVLITGSTSGLGREVARRLARSGDHVIVHGRDVDRGTALVEEIERETDGSARFYRADFASLDQIREFSEAILRDYDRLDVLVNNAGIWLESADGRRVSQDGHELHFQVNYLAGYLLTDMLLPLLRKSAPSRIVNVSSGAQRPIDFGDVMLEERYDPGRGYAQSKLAQVMFTFALAEELEGTGVTVNALHPATMMNTNMVLSRGARPRSDVEEGVEAVLHLVDAPAVGSGGYFDGTRPARANGQAYDEAARDRLMRLSQELTAG